MTAFLAVWLVRPLGVASVASPDSLPLVIITAWRTHAIFIDELMTTSAPIALVIAFVAQPEAGMFVQSNRHTLGGASPAALVVWAQRIWFFVGFADTVILLLLLLLRLVV